MSSMSLVVRLIVVWLAYGSRAMSWALSVSLMNTWPVDTVVEDATVPLARIVQSVCTWTWMWILNQAVDQRYIKARVLRAVRHDPETHSMALMIFKPHLKSFMGAGDTQRYSREGGY